VKWGRKALIELSFLLSAFVVLLEGRLLETGIRDSSALDGMYLPVMMLLATYVLLYISNGSTRRFVTYSMAFCSVLSVLPAVKYQWLAGGDVNYFYRIIEATVNASTLNGISEIPSSLVGIYPSFPGFVVLNVVFIKVVGVTTLTGYKYLYPILYGILYPAGFYLLSKLITDSNNLRRAVVMVAVIPYALDPGAPYNRFMMPNYFDFLLLLFALYIVLNRMKIHSRRTSYVMMLVLIFVAMAVTHPLASLYFVVIATGLLALKMFFHRFGHIRISSGLLTPSLIVTLWITIIAWSIYSSATNPFFQDALVVAVQAFLGAIRAPPVTQRLETAGPIIFLITHISKEAIGSFALLGIIGLAKKRIPESRISSWILSAAIFLFLLGLALFVMGYVVYDIYVAARALFLNMIALTLASGLGVAFFSKVMMRHEGFRRRRLRFMILGLVLFLVLTGSMFELYPTEYVNPTLVNSVHTIYQKDAIEFLNAHWLISSQITTDHFTFQVAQSFASASVFNNIIDPDLRQFFRLRNPLTSVIVTPETPADYAGVNIIYNSGFAVMNSTLT
jgi:hypothetical protein